MAGDKKKCRCADLGQVSRYTKMLLLYFQLATLCRLLVLALKVSILNPCREFCARFRTKYFMAPKRLPLLKLLDELPCFPSQFVLLHLIRFGAWYRYHAYIIPGTRYLSYTRYHNIVFFFL